MPTNELRSSSSCLGRGRIPWINDMSQMGTGPAGEYTFFHGKGNENHQLSTGLFVHKRIVLAEF
jgi:hypothetical protein